MSRAFDTVQRDVIINNKRILDWSPIMNNPNQTKCFQPIVNSAQNQGDQESFNPEIAYADNMTKTSLTPAPAWKTLKPSTLLPKMYCRNLFVNDSKTEYAKIHVAKKKQKVLRSAPLTESPWPSKVMNPGEGRSTTTMIKYDIIV